MQEDSLYCSLNFVNPRTAQNNEVYSFKKMGLIEVCSKAVLSLPFIQMAA